MYYIVEVWFSDERCERFVYIARQEAKEEAKAWREYTPEFTEDARVEDVLIFSAAQGPQIHFD